MTEGVTQEARASGRMEEAVQSARGSRRENRAARTLSGDGEGRRVPKRSRSHCQEKPLGRMHLPVPETDTGGRVENTEARGSTLVKELGKMAP